MLEAIGAGTTQTTSSIDFNDYYKHSTLCFNQQQHLESLLNPETPEETAEETSEATKPGDKDTHSETFLPPPQDIFSNLLDGGYPTSYYNQFLHLTRRTFLDYWRTPSYNFFRIILNVITALFFASAYPNQQYTDSIGTVSRSAVIFCTTLFSGVIGLMGVIEETFELRAVFYREQQSSMYSIYLFSITLTLAEVSLCFVFLLLITLFLLISSNFLNCFLNFLFSFISY